MENNTIKKMTKAQLDDAQTMDIYTYTYTVWGHDANDINSTWEGAITVNALLKASEILGLYAAKYPDHGTPTDCSLYTMHQMSIDCDILDSEYTFGECDWMTISDNCQKWRDTMYNLGAKDIDGEKTDKIRIYGKTLNRWTAAQTINDIERDVTTQIEIAYKDYYLDGTVAGSGSEDFSPERYRKEIATYEARTWDGNKRNRGGHKAWDQRDTYTIKRDNLKMLKYFCKMRYSADNIMMVKF